ncbi:MAG: hypothetical protein A3B44_01285 [Candidatus Levybacteria bacterium RIFCSPLOWO2_01_FULL_38_21]|nr:MAG: hypothetical protein A3B44_01285 [Candidatus Levybacteria bacterium RIFCSPLOWO2_01_FULL_38_21]
MISIIIVNYKVKKEILRCISSIYKSGSNLVFEIIVVDNDEKNTIEENLKKQFPKVKYVKSPKNIGFGAGNNLGAKYAKGEVLFFLNPDTEVLENSIDLLYKFLNSTKDVGGVSPILLNDRGVLHFVQGSQHLTILRGIFSLSFIQKISPNNLIAKKFFLNDWDKKTVREVDVVPGTAFMISKNLFDKIGGFDEKFFLFFEEADLARKISALKLKNYVIPQAKIIHLGRESTKKRDDIREIFSKSKFYYFKKWHGLLGALIVQAFTSISKIHLLLTAILLVGFFLRIFKLSEFMVFIGDQGWFYLSARDMLLTGKIPLVGITSSHTWLHQGPYWTYILGFIFLISNFNPVAPAYFTGVFGVISALLIYKVGSELFSKQIGLISGLLYATSPLIIFYDRMPYHTTLIPFFSLLFILSIYKWLLGKAIFFPAVILVISILYNLELATTSLWAVLIVFLIYGIYKKRQFVLELRNFKIILLSIFVFVVPMFPILNYDFYHGFPQTLKFVAWMGYKFLRLFGTPSVGTITEQSSYLTVLSFLLEFYKRLIFTQSYQVALILMIISFSIFFFTIYKGFKNKNLRLGYLILVVYFLISLMGFLIAKTPSEAYIPIFFPAIIIITGIFINKMLEIKRLKLIGILLLLFISSSSVYSLFTKNFLSKSGEFDQRLKAVDKIIQMTNGEKYNLLGKGTGSQFESFTMNYEYLLWWKGHPPSKESVKTKIIVSESPSNIIIEKK